MEVLVGTTNGEEVIEGHVEELAEEAPRERTQRVVGCLGFVVGRLEVVVASDLLIFVFLDKLLEFLFCLSMSQPIMSRSLYMCMLSSTNWSFAPHTSPLHHCLATVLNKVYKVAIIRAFICRAFCWVL